VRRRPVVLIAIGVVAGFFSGLLGVGGGVALAGYPAKTAMATSLGAIVFTAAAAALSHAQAGNVHWADAALIGLPATAGATAGAWLHQRLHARGLVIGFAAFLVAVAVNLAL
jgi:uncharacterized protein